MLGRDEKMRPGFVDFSNFAQGFGFGLILRTGSFQKPTRWDFARAVTQVWLA